MRRLSCILATILALAAGAAANSPCDETERQLKLAETERDLAELKLRRLQGEIDALGAHFAEAKYKALVDQIAREVAATRGLELRHAVESIVLDKPALAKLLERLMAEELPAAKLHGMQFMFEKLELIPAGSDIMAIYKSLLEGQVGGLYNPGDKSLYVVSIFDPASILGRIILAHEICHALQDQNFPIADLPFKTANEDANLAMGCVIEGDATLLMVEWAGGKFEMKDLLAFGDAMKQSTESINTSPPAVVQSLIFPYIGGLKFLQARMFAGPAADWRDEPFLLPPESTEQILHPAKYGRREPPVAVALPEWKEADGLREVYRNTQGEWGTRVFLTPPDAFPKIEAFTLEVMANEPVAVAAAEGWGGDQMLGVECADGKRWAMLWETKWDSEADAAEFASAFARRARLWPELAGGDFSPAAPGRAATASGSGRTVWMQATGAEVRIAVSESPATGQSARSAVSW